MMSQSFEPLFFKPNCDARPLGIATWPAKRETAIPRSETRIARNCLPDIAVLFTSGYTKAQLCMARALTEVELLSKPYAREEPARKLRPVLGEQKNRNARDVPLLCGNRVVSDSASRLRLLA